MHFLDRNKWVMHSKVIFSGNIAASIGYLFNPKRGEKDTSLPYRGEVILAHGVRYGGDPKNKIDDILDNIKRHPGIKNQLIHIPLSFHPDDKNVLEKVGMDTIVQDWIREYERATGFEFDRYFVVRHDDTKHPHCHFVASCVNDDGKVFKSSYSARKAMKVSQKITEKYGLSRGNKYSVKDSKGVARTVSINQAVNKEVNEMARSGPEAVQNIVFTPVQSTGYFDISAGGGSGAPRCPRCGKCHRGPCGGDEDRVRGID